ncbi:MAG: TlyA family RNA methyltransferase [Acidimicrobiia bacterium]|nr:TlyA family RNA methyltransferase [Acidimicrobiia bacterium]
MRCQWVPVRWPHARIPRPRRTAQPPEGRRRPRGPRGVRSRRRTRGRRGRGGCAAAGARRGVTRRRLDAELVRRDLARSRAEAKALIEEGLVVVGDNPEPKPTSQVDAGASIRLARPLHPYVGRGGLKLEAALDAFDLDVTGSSCIDVGASTGGFTDCLLQHGASTVVAVDVGYGQLDLRLRDDPRVTVRDRTNIRTADPFDLGAPFDVVVGDLSFISLCSVAEALAALGSETSDWVVLVKPQFEAGRDAISRGGIVRDPMARLAALEDVISCFADIGVGAIGAARSPVTGAKAGNVEFLLHARLGAASVTDADLQSLFA